MKKTGIFKAMKLCMDYKKMPADKREQTRRQRFKDIVEYARENSPYYKELYKDLPPDFTLADLPAVNKAQLMENWDDWVCDRSLKLADVKEFMKDKNNIGAKFKKEYMVFTTSGSTGNPLVAVVDKTANNIIRLISPDL